MSNCYNGYMVNNNNNTLSFLRDDFSPKFVALFVLLLFLKSFHWLAEDRDHVITKRDQTSNAKLKRDN